MAAPQGREPEVLGTDAPRLHERIAHLPRRTRLLIAAGTGLLLIAALAGYALTHRPDPPPPAPAAATRVRLTAVTAPDKYDGTFELRLRITAKAPVTLIRPRSGYRGLSFYLDPPPGALRTSQPTEYSAHAQIKDCGMLPLHRGTPVIVLVLHNTRGDGEIAMTPDRAQFDRLDRTLRDACRP